MKLPRVAWTALGLGGVVLFAKGLTFAATLVMRAL